MATVTNTIALRDRMSNVIAGISNRMRQMARDSESAAQAARANFSGMENAARAVEQSFRRTATGVNFQNREFVILERTVPRISRATAQMRASLQSDLNLVRTSVEQVRNAFGRLGTGIVVANQGLQLLQAGLQGMKNVTDVADSYTQINARLGLIVGKGETLAQLQDKIHNAAENARGSYNDMAGAVSKVALAAGKAFNNNNDEIIGFTELLQKSFVIGGTSAMNQAAAIQQISQALTAGKLQGDEFNSVMENAPIFAQKIKDSLHMSDADFLKFKEDGGITAAIMKNAMFNGADDINQKFKEIPGTFGEAFVVAKDKALRSLEPIFDKMNKWLNTGGAEQITTMFMLAAKAASVLADVIMFIGSNWKWVFPLIAAALVPLAVYFINIGVAAWRAGLQATIAGLKTFWAWSLANWELLVIIGTITALAIAWQYLGNVGRAVGIAIAGVLIMIAAHSMLAFWPLTIAIGVLALVAAAAVYFGQTWGDVFGYIGGAIGVLVAFFYNKFVELWNFFAAFGNFLGNLWNEPVYSGKKLIYDLVSNALEMLKTLASALDKVFGTNMGGALDNLKGKMKDWVGTNENYKTFFETKEYADISGAFEKGQGIGENFGNKIGGMLDKAKNAFKPNETKIAATKTPLGTEGDPVNTKVKGDVTISEEDLKYMRDLARVKFVNRYTTLRPSVNATFGDVRETADINAIVSHIAGIIEDSTNAALV